MESEGHENIFLKPYECWIQKHHISFDETINKIISITSKSGKYYISKLEKPFKSKTDTYKL